MEAKVGDRVILGTVKEDVEGVLLESSEPEIYLIKLKSGYNIGIKKEDVHRIEIIQERKEIVQKPIKPQINKNLPNVDMIITGGTISSRLDPETGAVKSLTNPADLLKFYPELLEICNIRKIEVPFMKLSENMDPLDWKEIATVAEKSLNDDECAGIIITHGTDILHYTSAALSFFLKDLNKPVVLTFAQRSSDRASSDASLNLQCAARAAVSDIAEVMIVGHGTWNDNFCYALLGTKVRKLHSSRRDAFKPVNTKPIARIYTDRIEIMGKFNQRNDKKVKLDDKFNDKVALLKFYPGMDYEILESYGRYSGIVIEGTGFGHVATDEGRKNLLPILKKLMDNGTIICMTTQTIFGTTNSLVYSAGRKILKTGVIYLEDMLPETAYVKLAWVLGHKEWRNKVKEKMLENISGEINKRLEE